MIHTEKGNTKIMGPRAVIVADFYAILAAGMKECPTELLRAMELFEYEMNEEMKEAEEGSSEDERLAASTAALSMLPEDKREEIKSKLRED